MPVVTPARGSAHRPFSNSRTDQVSSSTTSTPNLHVDDVARLVNLFHALADSTRLKLLTMLAAGEMNVGQLCASLHVKQPTVSHHLGKLRRAKLVEHRRAGKSIRYRLSDAFHERADGRLARIDNAGGIGLTTILTMRGAAAQKGGGN
jgi:DNA-binding transcriptional ArsR family regulator